MLEINILLTCLPRLIQSENKSVLQLLIRGSKTNEMSPGIQNLFSLLKASKSNRYPEFMDAYQNKNLQYSSLKDAVADAIIEMVIPIQKRKEELLTNKKELKDHIKSRCSDS